MQLITFTGHNKKISYHKQIAHQYLSYNNFARIGWVIDPVTIFLLSSLSTMQNWVLFLIPCACMYDVLKKLFRAVGSCPLGVADPLEICLSPVCYYAKFDLSGSDGMSIITDVHQKKLTARIPSFKVVHQNRHRLIGYVLTSDQ